ncbi:MAG: amidohydrolase family protein [Hyphomicrobiaceae bacterium]
MTTSANTGFRRDITTPAERLPSGSCDCHMHILGPYAEYPLRETRTYSPGESLLSDYQRMTAIVGIDRMVIVQPSSYAMDNRCTLAAVASAKGKARCVVVVPPDTDASDLRAMHEHGARGVRIQSLGKGGLSLDAFEAIADRIKDLGWHIQVFLDASQLPALADRFRRSPVDIVFDHMGQIDAGYGMDTPGFKILLELLSSGKAWVKLSNALFPPSAERARSLYVCNPERVVWGSDWPHLAYLTQAPDDGALATAVLNWFPDGATRRRVLVDNPTRLYFRD